MAAADIRFNLGRSIDPSVDTSDVKLRPEETFVTVKRIPRSTTEQQLTATGALQLLADVDSPDAIGKNGPVMAARVAKHTEENRELKMYEALFGRDALITALFVFHIYPELTRSTLIRLAELQGVKQNIQAEEEPGEIPHEVRDEHDPVRKELTEAHGWEWPYYGSIDATILFIRLFTRYVLECDYGFLDQTYKAQDNSTKRMIDAFDAACAWLMYKMDENDEHFVESRRLNSKSGTVNQAWKDSLDAYHHADGTLANSAFGITSIEVQAYAYDALLDASQVCRKMVSHHYTKHTGRNDHIAIFEQRAEKLRKSIWDLLWIEDDRGGYFALGSDRDEQGNIRPLKVRSSNMGHLLNSRLLDGDDAEVLRRKELLVKTLFSSDMCNVSGIRTLSSYENRYRPNAYHNGSVWPWDTYYIALGLRRQGYIEQAQNLESKIMHVIQTTKVYPEFVSGDDALEPHMPDRSIGISDSRYSFEHFIEVPPQKIQAWTVAAAVAIERERSKAQQSGSY